MNQTSQLKKRIVQDAVELCSVFGIMVKQKEDISDPGVVHCPFSLFPTPMPQDALEKGLMMQPLLAQVVAGIINNPTDYIRGIL